MPASDVILTVLLTVGEVILCLCLAAIVVLESFSVAACGPTHPCDFQLFAASQYVTPIAGIVALVGTVVLGIALGRRGRRVWWAPIFGVVLVIVAFVVASVLNHVSTA